MLQSATRRLLTALAHPQPVTAATATRSLTQGLDRDFDSPPLPSPPSRAEIFAKFPPRGHSAALAQRQAWIESLGSVESAEAGELVDLHPEVWAVRPRVDNILKNVEWQQTYRWVELMTSFFLDTFETAALKNLRKM